MILKSSKKDTNFTIKEIVDPSNQTIDIPTQKYYDKREIRFTILEHWEKQQNEERKLRTQYSNYLLYIFVAQLIIMYYILFLIIRGLVVLTDKQFFIIFVTVFFEITALVAIVTKYLFSNANALNISDLFKK